MTAQIQMEQGTQEWLDLRKSKITATDAAVIMGLNPWKTKAQLYKEKKGEGEPSFVNESMKRGIDAEPKARRLFILETGIIVNPAVVVKDWAMASLDGLSTDGKTILEVKANGTKNHELALQGRIPEYYFAQMQHQLYVCDSAEHVIYYSYFDDDSVAIPVYRDEEFIKQMVEAEKEFYQTLVNDTPPEPDYVVRDDAIWIECAQQLKSVQQSIKDLEAEEEKIRKKLIFLSGESNSKGGGLTLTHVSRKGNVDYAKIPELKGVDLEPYRKPITLSWRITNE